MLKSLNRFFCRHKMWIATEPLLTNLDGGIQSVTWQKMTCSGCGKVRKEAMLKPGEEVIVSLEVHEDLTN